MPPHGQTSLTVPPMFLRCARVPRSSDGCGTLKLRLWHAQAALGRGTHAPISVLLGLFALTVVAACARRPMPDPGGFLASVTKITLVTTDEARQRELLATAFDRIAEIERALSTQQPVESLAVERPEFELARVNEHAASQAVAVSEDLFAAVQAGVEWRERSLGAFDITISPLLQHWRRCAGANRLPTDKELARLRTLVGVERIAVDPAARTIRFPAPGMHIDLGGLGKGFCVREVVKTLQQHGVSNALVAVGGDIYALGNRPGGGPWRIGVRDPRQPESPSAILTTVALTNRAVSTSGNYERFVTIQGQRYSHIIDPRTGRAADNVPSVTVIGLDTVTTDVLGTALSVLGVEEGLRLVESMPEVEALFVTFDDKNRPCLTRSAGFARYEAKTTRDTDYRK